MISEPQMANITKDQTVLRRQNNERPLDQLPGDLVLSITQSQSLVSSPFCLQGTSMKWWMKLIYEW